MNPIIVITVGIFICILGVLIYNKKEYFSSYNFGFPTWNALNRSQYGVTAGSGNLNPYALTYPYNIYNWSNPIVPYRPSYNPFLDRLPSRFQISDDFDCYPSSRRCVRGFGRIGRQCCRRTDTMGYF